MNQQNNLLQKFVNLYVRIEDMGSNFNRSRLQEYTELCEKMYSCAAEIIKADLCPYHFCDSDSMELEINGKFYRVSIDDISSILDTSELKILLAKRHEEEKEEERKQRKEEKKMDAKNIETGPDMQNPFGAMAQYFMAPFMAAMSANQGIPQIPIPEPKETTALEDLIEVQKKVVSLQEKSKAADEAISKAEELEDEVERLKDQCATMSKEKDEMEELWSSAVEENDKYKKQLKSAEDSRASMREEIKKLNERVKKTENTANVAPDELKKVKEERDKLKASLATAEEKLINLTKENAALSNSMDSAENLKKEIAKYREMAYTDQKYGVMNANAYHHFINTCEKDKVTVSVCGICNTKQINQLYGRVHGDRVIESVAKKLSALFGKENVYRVYGDQFFILTKNSDSSKIKGQLATLQNELFSDMVSVAFGVIDAVTCDDMAQAIKQAEGDMNGMKVKDGHKKIVENELNRMKQEMDSEKAKQEQTNSVEPTVEDTPVESFSEDEVDVLSKTVMQEMTEPEIRVDSNVSSSGDELFDSFE